MNAPLFLGDPIALRADLVRSDKRFLWHPYTPMQKYIDEVVVVKEASLKTSIGDLLRRHRMVVEGSAALGLAAITGGLLPKGLKRVCVVLSGANIDVARVKDIVNHHLEA